MVKCTYLYIFHIFSDFFITTRSSASVNKEQGESQHDQPDTSEEAAGELLFALHIIHQTMSPSERPDIIEVWLFLFNRLSSLPPLLDPRLLFFLYGTQRFLLAYLLFAEIL